MPSANRIPEAMRWDVVNYVRGLQGRFPVATGPVGFPGQASAYPGHSVVGPTVPSAFRKPSISGMTPKAASSESHGESHEAPAKAEGGHNGGHQ